MDNITGTTGNDTINGTGATLTALDAINGGAGNDKLSIKDADGVMNTVIPAGLNITNVEVMEIQTSGNLGRSAGEGVTETTAVTFQALGANQTIIIDGRTVTAGANGATAADVATAFASGTTNAVGGATPSGSLQTTTATLGGTLGNVVTLKSTTANSDRTDLVATGTAVTGIAATAATPQITKLEITDAGDTFAPTDTVTFTYNGVSLTTAAIGGTDSATEITGAISAVVNAINAYAGSTIASVGTGADLGKVVITSNTPVSLAGFAGTSGHGTFSYALTQSYVAGTAAIPAAAPTLAITQGAEPSVTAAAYDVSGIASLTDVNIAGVAGMGLKAAATQNVTVSGATGDIAVTGGKDVTITDATAGKGITVGDNTAAGGDPAGKITITDSNNTGANAITAIGGTDVTITTTADKATSGTITVGHATNGQASGPVVITQNSTSNGTAMTAGDVTVTGGSTVNITANMTNTAVKGGATGAITAGTYTVVGGNTTTAVTITQNATATDFANDAAAAVKETTTITFKAMASGENVTITDGTNALTFTASKALTASEAAEAFAGLISGDRQDAGGKVANGIYTGQFSTAWTSAAANGAVVVFTANSDIEADLAFTGSSAAATPTQVKTAGTAAGASTAVDISPDYGNVVINDNATPSITDVTLNGYNTATIGTTAELSKLVNLSLANSTNRATVDMGTAATMLNLTLNNVDNNVVISTDSTAVATLNVTATGSQSDAALTIGSVKDLNVSGDSTLVLNGSTTTALENVKVTGSASVNLTGISVNAAKSINTTGTTGAVTALINGTAATYTGGAGVDTVTLVTGTALDKAIDLGAGDDTLVFTANVTGSSTTLSGGDGTDTLSMSVARADALDASAVSFYTNFERLTLNNKVDLGTADVTVNLENLGFVNYVTTSGTNDTDGGAQNRLILSNLANNGTVVLTGTMDTNSAGIQVNIKDAATGTADALNVIANVAASNVDFGTLTAANVETINITANDTKADDNGDGTTTTAESAPEKTTLTLTADKATTVNVTGSADVDLVLTGSDKVTLIDGSSMTGALNVTSVSTAAAIVIKGGSGNDTLVSAATSTKADELMGGAGNDSLTANKGMTKMTGGAGADTFNIVVASTNVNSAATIMDIGTGDVIKFANADAFKSAAVTLDSTAVFQDFANAAIASITSDNDLAWFQFGGNTYIVQEKDNSTNADVFTNNEDFIVKITGTVDLSTASFNATSGTLEIA